MPLHATYVAGVQYYPTDMMQRDQDFISPGVITTNDLVVAPTGTPSMAVTVSGATQGSVGGNAWLPGGYRVYNDAQATLTIAAADATNPRIDLVVAAIDTTATPYTPSLRIIAGTPAASPVAPSVPVGLIVLTLAQIAVAANATSIVAANITDKRVIAGLQGDGSRITNIPASAIPVATTTTVGAVKGGTSVLVAGDGTLSATPTSIGAATAAQGAKADTALQTSQLGQAGGVAKEDDFTAHLADDVHHVNYSADTGAADAYVVTLSPVPTAWVAGMTVSFLATHANTGASTISITGLTGTKSITKNVSIALTSGDILAGQIITVEYDGTNCQMVPTNILNASASSPGVVEVVEAPASGAPVTPTRVASFQETEITGTTVQTVLTYTPRANHNFELNLSFSVITASTNVTITVTYTDARGTQTYPWLPITLVPVGPYALIPFSFNAVTSGAITVTVTAGTINQVFVSGVLKAV